MRLDDDYANGPYIPNGSDYPDQWAIAAREFREVELACGRARLNQPYGDGQFYDLFMPSARPAGTVIFVHGGFWKAFDPKDWSHLGAGVMARDWAFAVVGYPLAPEASIPEITVSIREGVEAVANAVEGPISLTGHSAGGHLVARMLMEDVGLAPEVAARVAVTVPISPVGDLRDLMQTAMATELRLTKAVVDAESPTLGVKALDVPVTVWVGVKERPKFLAQAEDLSRAWQTELVVVQDRHHFNVIEDLIDPDGDLVSLLTGGQT